MSRGAASLSFEGDPREPVSSKILWDQHGAFKVELFQFTERIEWYLWGGGPGFRGLDLLTLVLRNQ